MSELNQSYPGILLAYLNGTHYTLDNSDCNELSKLFQRVEDDRDALRARIAELEAENAALKEAHKKLADNVMNIIGDALSGDCDRYLNYDPSGKRYCKWGIVEKDIRSLFELPQSPEVE